MFCVIFFLMIRRPPRSTRTDTLCPYTTLFRSHCVRSGSIGRGRHLSLGQPFLQDRRQVLPRGEVVEDHARLALSGLACAASRSSRSFSSSSPIFCSTVHREDRKSTRLNSSH